MNPEDCRVVALDNSALTHWIMAKPGEESLHKDARSFVSDLLKRKGTVLIPSVVLFEACKVAPSAERREALIQSIAAQFEICPFNLKAAARAAAIYRERVEKGIAASPDMDKIVLSADMMVQATALAFNAEFLVTYERRLERWRKDTMEAGPFPVARKGLFDATE